VSIVIIKKYVITIKALVTTLLLGFDIEITMYTPFAKIVE
jgi:hypothetical protein